MDGGGGLMTRKKTADELKLVAVKIERDIVTRAKMISAEQGVSLAGYLSTALRTTVDRDWARMVDRAAKGGGR
jgi:hypothetical protein